MLTTMQRKNVVFIFWSVEGAVSLFLIRTDVKHKLSIITKWKIEVAHLFLRRM
jgi:hypothetical protein